ncbi:hypothetical protein [Vreelandella venusta]|uniref:Uncharacterized protein n=1 Tax=Vreelandella venusta TaxID=44935 RepID=A0ABX2B9A6_9GAMM|nr:hypothetical protein [Halomonas venusta]AZM96101.1 hypothetical protein EI420_10580 [Halomonas venusta]NPT30607.1 hypothetical protein [Halomonas venusta]
MDYEKWRITFQSSEQAAKAAYEESQRWERLFASVLLALVGVGEAVGVRGEDQLNGNLEILIAIEKLKERRDKWKARALEAEQERDAMAAHIERVKAAVKQLENDCFVEDVEFPEMFDFLRDEDETPASSLAHHIPAARKKVSGPSSTAFDDQYQAQPEADQ